MELCEITHALALAAALSVDSLASGLACGADKIKIPLRSALIIAAICSLTFGATLLLGGVLQPWLPPQPVKWLSFVILAAIGAFKLAEAWTKTPFATAHSQKTPLRLLDKNFSPWLLHDEMQADKNKDKVLSAKEAVPLSAALSLDGLAAGISAGLGGVTPLAILFAFVLGFFAVSGGQKIGKKLAEKSKIDLSWLAGVIFIAMAIGKLN